MSKNRLINYEALFGNLDFTAADEYRSVLSPAAYLTDIMDLKDWKYDDPVKGAQEDAVDDRRDDISEILLNAENTITEIPYLDVVNQVMEKKALALADEKKPPSGEKYTSANELLKSGQVVYPLNLPYDHDKAGIRKLLGYLKSAPHRFYGIFTSHSDAKVAAREYLGLSQEEVEVIFKVTSGNKLIKCYGLQEKEELSLLNELKDIRRFRKATGLSAMQVNELLFQNLSDQEINNNVSAKLFINQKPGNTNLYLKTVTIDSGTANEHLELKLSDEQVAISEDYFDRIHRFLRLASRMGLTFAELDQIIITACNAQLNEEALPVIAAIHMLHTDYKIPVDELCTLFSGMKEYGQGDKTERADLYFRIFEKGYSVSLNSLTNPSVLKNRLQACLGCDENEYNRLVKYLADAGKAIPPNPANPDELKARLAMLYRIKRLAEMLEISIGELFLYLDLIDYNQGHIRSVSFPLPIPFGTITSSCREILLADNPSPANTLSLVELLRALSAWMSKNELSIEQLWFICSGRVLETVESVLGSDEVADLFRNLDGQFRPALMNPSTLESGIVDQTMAQAWFGLLSASVGGYLNTRGIVKNIPATSDILNAGYKQVAAAILLLDPEDFLKTQLSPDKPNELKDLFNQLQNYNYVDVDGYLFEDKINFFLDGKNAALFIVEPYAAQSPMVFQILSDRAKKYDLTAKNMQIECDAVVGKIRSAASRQKSSLYAGLGGGLNLDQEVARLLCEAIFITRDESPEMAVVRFMDPVLFGIDQELATGKLLFSASLVTSLSRLQRFSLIASKLSLNSRELEVLLKISNIQASLPEKLKLPEAFPAKIDSVYNDANGDVMITSGSKYAKYSGSDYAFLAMGELSSLPGIPGQFASAGIDAAFRDKDGKVYLFSGSSYIDASKPTEIQSIANNWGKVRNPIVEDNQVDAAYLSPDNKAYLFSKGQYVRYSGNNRDFVDEGYPKQILTYWNSENQIQLPVEIRGDVRTTVQDANGEVYFFSAQKYVASSAPTNIQPTRSQWGKVRNNISDLNKVDAALFANNKTYLFCGDQYARYSGSDLTIVDEGYPKKIKGNWNQEGLLPVSGDYENQVVAAFQGADNQVYLFNGNTFISSTNPNSSADVNTHWGKVLNNIRSLNRVDAALVAGGKTYLFSGDQYARYSGSDYTSVDEGYPKKIAVNWNSENCGTLTLEFNSGIAAALNAPDNTIFYFAGNQSLSSKPGAVPMQVKDQWGRVRNNIAAQNDIDAGFTAPDGKTYLFCGGQFYRYSGGNYALVDEGYPLKIKGRWGSLPDSFCDKIDAAFMFKEDGVNRLYLISGNYYARYSENDYSVLDAGYPKQLDKGNNSEDLWFEPIFRLRYRHPWKAVRIISIFTDVYKNKPRINFFFEDYDHKEKLARYEYSGSKYSWTDDILVSQLPIAPFTSVDAGFMGSDGKVYLISNGQIASMKGNYTGINTPVAINSAWGKVANKFQELNRIDASLSTPGGVTYLFCDSQYVRYSGDIKPENDSFYVDEGYPKTINAGWTDENAGISVPSVFQAQGFAILRDPQSVIHVFAGNTVTTSQDPTPVQVNAKWGKVQNNIESQNRLDAAFVNQGKTYLFCGDQYVRYSNGYTEFVDEGYPKKIARLVETEKLTVFEGFANGVETVLEHADGEIYVFAGGEFVRSSEPGTKYAINQYIGIVRNLIASTGAVDAAFVSSKKTLYLFSGDQYFRYSSAGRDFVDEGYPKKIKGNWKDIEGNALPSGVEQGLSAAFTDKDGESYLFANGQYLALSNPSVLNSISSKWGKVKNNFPAAGKVDAAFLPQDNMLYLFSGDQFTRYSNLPVVSNGEYTYADEGYPKKIAGNWGDLPADWCQGLDAVFVFDGRTYFIRQDEYIRYSDPACRTMDAGFPKKFKATMNNAPEINLSEVRQFQQFKSLVKQYNNTDYSLLQFLKSAPADSDQAQLALVTGWPLAEIAAIANDQILSKADCRDIQALSEMDAIFAYAAAMSSLPSSLKANVWNLLFGTPTNHGAGADFLEGLLKTATGQAGWTKLSAEVHNQLNLSKRDALLGYLLHELEQVQGTEWIENPRDLYEYLLIDVEMGEEATTSRIQEALMCMQLFYHRTLMNLEEDNQAGMQGVKDKLKAWWEWMKNYRVWEANRKVFVYPENYIRPELRGDKSPEFKELEEELLQGEIDSATAEKAYTAYLEKFGVVSKLKIAGGYVYQKTVGSPTDESQTGGQLIEKKIFIFGYSYTEPKKYYYMVGNILENKNLETGQMEQTIDWDPWKDIRIIIDAEKVYPVFAFNRLFVFWFEVRERDKSTYSVKVGPDTKITQYDPIIKYSFYNLRNEWAQPQEMFNVGTYVDKLSAGQQKLFQDDSSLKGLGNHIPAKEVLNGARLFVTNPITSRYYNADEFIYINYEVRYQTFEFTLEGKLKSNLEFEQPITDYTFIDKLEKNIQFPFEKFGITPTSFSHWKGFFNDSFSAPWFSFNAAGGSFLIKPEIVADSPIPQTDKKLYGRIWENLPDSGFMDKTNRKHLFYRERLDAPYRADQDKTDSIDFNELKGEYIKDKYLIIDQAFANHGVDLQAEFAGQALKIVEALNELILIPNLLALLENKPVNVQPGRAEIGAVYNNKLKLTGIFPKALKKTTAQYYIVKDGDQFSEPALVSEIWGKRNVFSWLSPAAESVVVNGDKLFIAVAGERYISYTGPELQLIDQKSTDATAVPFSLEDLLPVTAAPETWHSVKQDLRKYIENLTKAFVYQNQLYLVKGPDNAKEYTIPTNLNDFWMELAALVPETIIANQLRPWNTIQAATLFSGTAGTETYKRLYITHENDVFVKDYIANTHAIHAVSDLIHPDLGNIAYDAIPSPAVERPWSEVEGSLSEFLMRLAGVGKINDQISLFANRQDGSIEVTTPDQATLFHRLADIINHPIFSPQVDMLTELTGAKLYANGSLKRLYILSGTTVVIFDYTIQSPASPWSVKSTLELIHPDVTAIETQLPALPAAMPWPDVAEDFGEYMATVERALVWKGVLYLLTPKNSEYIAIDPTQARDFWQSVSEKLDNVEGFASIDAAGVLEEDSRRTLYIACGQNLVMYDLGDKSWRLSDIQQTWGVNFTNFTKINGIIQTSGGNIYIFSGDQFAEKQGNTFVVSTLISRWGTMANAIINGMIDAAYLDGDGRAYLFYSGEVDGKVAAMFARYANVDTKTIDFGYPKSIADEMGIDENDIKKEFSNTEKVTITKFGAYTAFKQKLHKHTSAGQETEEEKMYLFLDISAEITKYIWKWRWRWYGGWRWRNVWRSGWYWQSGIWGWHRYVWFSVRQREWWGWWAPEWYLEEQKRTEKKSFYLRFSRNGSGNYNPGEVDMTKLKPEYYTKNYKLIDDVLKKEWPEISPDAAFEQHESKILRGLNTLVLIPNFIDLLTAYQKPGDIPASRADIQTIIKNKQKLAEIYPTAMTRTLGNDQFVMDDNYPKSIIAQWSRLPGDFNKMITATFEDTQGTGDQKKDVFYVVRGPLIEQKDGHDVVTNDYVQYVGEQNFPKEISEEVYEIIRLTSKTSEVLSQKLFMDGIDGLLALETQQIEELPRFGKRLDNEDDLIAVDDETQPLTLRDNRANDLVVYKPQYIGHVPQGASLDYGSINGQYYWEVYFHAPFLIAQALNGAQKFKEGRKWYEYIFDPTETGDATTEPYWNFLPFHQDIANSQSAELNNLAQYNRYLNDPFDPHAIAGLRQVAYRKCIVMNYIDNLVDWGDMLFRQYTRESINEARMLYVLAYDLLGKKPELTGTRRLTEAKTYKALREEKAELLKAMIELENLPGNAQTPLAGSGSTPNGTLLDPYGYFYVPENSEFNEYWNRVEDRLLKIRLSLNIEGVKQRLALFEPPIDVMALVRAVSGGASLAQALADFNVAVPHYRFNFILAKARELTARLTQFGQSLLSTLEKKDGEELSLLRNTQEKAILDMTLNIKNSQLEDARETLKSLQVSLKSAQIREKHYSMLLSVGLSSFEKAQLQLLGLAQLFTILSQGFSIAAGVGGIIPELGMLAWHWGGHNLNAMFNSISQVFGAISGQKSFEANLASILGGYLRREQDWTLQKQTAQCDIENIQRQIAGGEIKVRIARQDIEIARKNIQNNESVDTFMKSKFTNKQLYQWMAGKLAGLYFQTYQMALDLAKAAQRAFQYEMALKESEVSFIGSLYWDSLKKGLLAGESLQVDLDRMEKAYLEKNRRRLEISKSISLLQLNSFALLDLRNKRICEFTLDEKLFDFDFPGHYCRQIKTVSLTFPAVTGPYKNINATLTQLSHYTLLEPDKTGVSWLLNPDPKDSQPLSIRADWRVNQQIALSRGVNDAGLFQLNFQDERYLPFEGTGAVSIWRLELTGLENTFDLSTLTDVVIQMEYSALQGGEVFAAAVKKQLKTAPGIKLLNLAQQYPDAWGRFMADPAQGLAFTLAPDLFPGIKSNKITGLYMLYLATPKGAGKLGNTSMQLVPRLNGSPIEVKNATIMEKLNLTLAGNGTQWKLTPKGGSEDYTSENIVSIVLVCSYDIKADF